MSSTQERPNLLIMVTCGLLTSLVVIAFARMAYGLILPPMRADLGLSYQQAGVLGTITALGYLGFVLAGGIAAARFGARITIVFGLVSVALGFAGLTMASHYWLLLALMALLGFGTAFSFAPMVSLLATWYPEKRGLVIGLMTSGVGLGVLLVGALVPWMTSLFGDDGWRVSWGIFCVVAVVVAVLITVFAKDPPRLATGAHESPPSDDKWLIYRNGRVVTVATVYAIIGVTYIVQAIFMVSFMVEEGHSETTAGAFMAMMGLLSIAAGPLWGWLSDHWGRGNSLASAMGLVTLAMGLPLLDQSLLLFFLHFLIMGLSVNGMFALIQASATDQVAPRYIPIAFSFVTVFFATGQLIGPAVAGWLIEMGGGFRVAFGFTFVVLLAGAYLTLRIRRFPRGWAVGESKAD
ncbi:MFS transporter [Marinobacter zhanjiangensis]|uniref:MFS transporter n=1 Tax=Marinobacter zhanjiangensis TaxID=578215 RepID=A0ABQ3AN08_9GAMM|nr:MFS transporter [Marinobacter zhanjiangensis]GGY62373.1 MFS transporter [Marinobacter zhanjiangensis]